jgi:hypothetical protein
VLKAAGFFTALFLAWPFIIYWDILARPDIRELRGVFLCAYFLYFVSYAYFCGLGVTIAVISVRQKLPTKLTAKLGLEGRSGWYEAIRTSFMGTLASGIATYLATSLGSPG